MKTEETQNVLFMGDFHGLFDDAYHLYDKLDDEYDLDIDLMVQVGDFGLFPSGPISPHTRSFDHRCVWIDGNHENYDVLQAFREKGLGDAITGDPYMDPDVSGWKKMLGEVWEYKPRGSVEDGILYIGGAASPDREHRVPGMSWWPEEDIQQEDRERTWENIEEYGSDRIHTVVSHECPAEFDVAEACGLTGGEIIDDNRLFLQDVLEEVQPDHWVFGHYHSSMTGEYEGTKWRMVDMIRDTIPALDNDFYFLELPVPKPPDDG